MDSEEVRNSNGYKRLLNKIRNLERRIEALSTVNYTLKKIILDSIRNGFIDGMVKAEKVVE